MEKFSSQNLYEELNLNEKINLKELRREFPVNNFVLVENPEDNKKILGRVGIDYLTKVNTPPDNKFHGIASKDAAQAGFLNLLSDPSVKIVVCFGAAGTGKTTLALAYALETHTKDNKKICLSKPTALVGKGKTFGTVPGDVKDKYAPHVASYKIIMKSLCKGRSPVYLDKMEEREDLEFVPVEYVRGNNYENCIFILDEAQNLDWAELKTVASRINESSKLIILTDLNQIDTGMPAEKTGVYQLIHSAEFQMSPLSASIELEKQYRGPIPDLIYRIDMGIRKNSQK